MNLLPVVPGIGGSWHYIANLLASLAGHDDQNEYVGFVTGASAPIFPVTRNFTAVNVRLHAPFRPLRVVYESTRFASLSRGYHLDVMHHLFGTLPFMASQPTVVTVCDLMAFARPQDFSQVKRAYLRLMRWRVATSATMLAPMSHATAETLRDWMGVPSERMRIVPPAMPKHYTRATDDVAAAFRARHGLPDEFWLCVAGDYPHKNISRLIEAYARMRSRLPEGWSLVIRGSATPDLQRRVAHFGVQSKVQFLPWLSDEEMPLLYSAASALIFPSLFEGGGLPVLEAMACECPVVASDLPTTREFAGGAALTFDPGSISDMSRAMEESERSPQARADCRQVGLARVAQFAPSVAARACLDAYREAVTQYASTA